MTGSGKNTPLGMNTPTPSPVSTMMQNPKKVRPIKVGAGLWHEGFRTLLLAR